MFDLFKAELTPAEFAYVTNTRPTDFVQNNPQVFTRNPLLLNLTRDNALPHVDI
jgi:hypothetical protein